MSAIDIDDKNKRFPHANMDLNSNILVETNDMRYKMSISSVSEN